MNSQKLGPIQQKWIDALRSGKYKQGKGRLCTTDDKFCCLGVLCDILDVPKKERKNYYLYGEPYSLSATILPKSVVEQVGLFSSGGAPRNSYFSSFKNIFSRRSYYLPLYVLNDMKDKSFSEIADIISENPSEYFKEEK